jgi:hypothetical protein
MLESWLSSVLDISVCAAFSQGVDEFQFITSVIIVSTTAFFCSCVATCDTNISFAIQAFASIVAELFSITCVIRSSITCCFSSGVKFSEFIIVFQIWAFSSDDDEFNISCINHWIFVLISSDEINCDMLASSQNLFFMYSNSCNFLLNTQISAFGE